MGLGGHPRAPAYEKGEPSWNTRGKDIEMDRRRFIKNSIITGGALLANRTLAKGTTTAQQSVAGDAANSVIDKSHFPNGFLWGMASAAYQVEGAWNLDG